MSVPDALARVRDCPFVVDALRAADALSQAAASDRGAQTVAALTLAACDPGDQLAAIAAVHALGRVFDDSADGLLSELLSTSTRSRANTPRRAWAPACPDSTPSVVSSPSWPPGAFRACSPSGPSNAGPVQPPTTWLSPWRGHSLRTTTRPRWARLVGDARPRARQCARPGRCATVPPTSPRMPRCGSPRWLRSATASATLPRPTSCGPSPGPMMP